MTIWETSSYIMLNTICWQDMWGSPGYTFPIIAKDNKFKGTASSVFYRLNLAIQLTEPQSFSN